MIIKSVTHKNLRSPRYLIRYMLSGMDPEMSILHTHNAISDNTEGWIKEFNDLNKARRFKRINGVVVEHFVLSFPKDMKDVIDKEALTDVVEHFLSLRVPRGLAIAVSHVDRGNLHCHVCASSVDLAGNSQRITINEFTDLKIQVQEYALQRLPKMRTVADHGRKRREQQEAHKKRQQNSLKQKEDIAVALRTEFELAYTRDDFEKALEKHGLSIYSRRGVPTGLTTSSGVKVRFSSIGFSKDELSTLDESEERFENIKTLRSSIGQKNAQAREAGRSSDDSQRGSARGL